jgi:hypothetical protein
MGSKQAIPKRPGGSSRGGILCIGVVAVSLQNPVSLKVIHPTPGRRIAQARGFKDYRLIQGKVRAV